MGAYENCAPEIGVSVLKVDIAGAVKKKMGDFRFWIESDAYRVSLCFRYLQNVSVLWNYIQGSLG